MTRFKIGPTKTIDGRDAVIMDIHNEYAYFRVKDVNAFHGWFTGYAPMNELHNTIVTNVEPEVLEFKGVEFEKIKDERFGIIMWPMIKDLAWPCRFLPGDKKPRKWTMILKEEI